MAMAGNFWLHLQKSDETRVSKGIDSYQDEIDKVYHYDSKVPNHKQIAENDYVIIKKEASLVPELYPV